MNIKAGLISLCAFAATCSWAQTTKLTDNPKFSTAGFYEVKDAARSVANFNLGWRFHKGSVQGAEKVDFDDSSWEAAAVPHSLELLEENASGGRNYQGEAWYRKRFSIDRAESSERVYIYFEAVMGKSKVWVNGQEVAEHFGGYLPFAVDVTDAVKYNGESNIVAVLADNSDDTSYPMGKNQAGADLSYLGGIYRDVYMIETPTVHVTLTELSKTVAGGGIFVATTDLKGNDAEVTVRTEIQNSGAKGQKVVLKTIIEDYDYKAVASAEKKVSLSAGKSVQLEQVISAKDVHLWHPEDPYLHFVKTEIWIDGKLEDTFRTRFGIRTFEMAGAEGLRINGEIYDQKLIGANRHQDYVYVGNSLPNSGQWRDVKLLREGGCNIIRAAHYPLDPAYYDACDEFGMLTTSATPGWHFFNFKEPIFEERLYRDTRDLVRKDRNRASILMWETALNETPQQPDHALSNMHQAAHDEYPFKGMYTVTDFDEANKGGFDMYYHGDSKTINSFTRECGDGNEVDNWYSHNAVTRVKMEWGEKALIGQVENLAYTLSSLNNTSKVRLGGALWAGIEHQRGYHPDPFWGGLLNLYRLPKYSYFLFKSQYPVDYKIKNKEVGPMIYIANEFTQMSPKDITVFSNCDEVRLSFEGEVIATAKPSTEGGYKGLPHAPFVFKDAFDFKGIKKAGGKQTFLVQFKAEGLIDGKVVVEEKKAYPLRSEAIRLEVDTEGMALMADGSDFIPVRATIVDANGTKKVLASEYVHFELEGEGEIIGGQSNFANPMKTQFGVATILVRATDKSGKIRIKATSKGHESDQIEFESVASDMSFNYDKKYAESSVKPNVDNIIVVEEAKDNTTSASQQELQKELDALKLEMVGKDQEIMELRSQVGNKH